MLYLVYQGALLNACNDGGGHLFLLAHDAPRSDCVISAMVPLSPEARF